MNISFDTVAEFIYKNLQLPQKKGTGEFVARCPICGDSAKNLKKRRGNLTYKNPETILWHCYNCNESGDFIGLGATLKNITPAQVIKQIRGNSLENLKLKSAPVKQEVKQEIIYEDFSGILQDTIIEPEGIIQNKLGEKFQEFKTSRKIDYEMFVTYKGLFKNRVILPIYQDNQMVYFQARALFKSDKKYKNPTSPKQHIIFNKDNWDPNKPVVITEGMMDALSIGKQGTMCLGASISKEFIDKVPNPIISLDNDETGKRETLKLAGLYPALKFCIYKPEHKHIKDLNELLINGIEPYEYVTSNSYSAFDAKLRLKISM